MANVIEIRNLVRRFGPQTVLDGINLDIAEGETMVIMGGSGCGKSTLLRHLIGSLQPSEGSIKIFGEEIATVGEAGLDAVRKKFGILFQSGALFNSMSIADNIALVSNQPVHHSSLNNPALGNDLKQREYEIIMNTLRNERDSRKNTAERLGISARTLRYKIARLREEGYEITE